MKEKIPKRKNKTPESLEKKTERELGEIADLLWSGADMSIVFTRARKLFPEAKPPYLRELIGRTIETEAQFVYQWLPRDDTNREFFTGLTLEEFTKFYKRKRQYAQEARDLPPK